MLRIQRSASGRVVFTLSGRIEAEDVKELGQLLALETAAQQLVLDFRDVTLVNQDAVEFLAGCEADSIKLENCPALYPSVDRAGEKPNHAPPDSMNGFEVSGRLEACRLERVRPQMGHTDVRRLLETRKSDFRVSYRIRSS